MDKRGKKAGMIAMLALLLIFVICIGAYWFYEKYYVEETVSFESVAEVFYNPLMGFAISADYPDAVQENTLVYVDITWREWEPEQGVYAIEAIKENNFWERWQSEGKNVVLRFVCDVPGDEEHMDIPDWLYEQTGDGVFYDTDYGKGYAPNYDNPLLIEAHKQAIIKLGESFGQDSMVAFVQLGSLGHWGEWHMHYTQGTTRIPAEEVRLQYVEPYLEAFPNARFLARRPFVETTGLHMGLYNDMAGEPQETNRWLVWIAEGGVFKQPVIEEKLVAYPLVWEQAPVGGEFTSSLEWDEMLDKEINRTLELLEESHMTFIGPKCPVKEEVNQYREGVSEVLQAIGYRYGVRSVKFCYWKMEEKGCMTLEVENSGSAPIYFPWKMYLYVYQGEKLLDRMEVPVDLMQLCGGEVEQIVLPGVPVAEGYAYAVAIENPDTGTPAVRLDMECPEKEKEYIILKIDDM